MLPSDTCGVVIYDELLGAAKFCISGFSRDMIVNHERCCDWLHGLEWTLRLEIRQSRIW